MIDSYIPTFSHTHIFLHIVRVINRSSYIKTIEDLRIKVICGASIYGAGFGDADLGFLY